MLVAVLLGSCLVWIAGLIVLFSSYYRWCFVCLFGFGIAWACWFLLLLFGVFCVCYGVGLFVINVGFRLKFGVFTVCYLICVCLLFMSDLRLFNDVCYLVCYDCCAGWFSGCLLCLCLICDFLLFGCFFVCL